MAVLLQYTASAYTAATVASNVTGSEIRAEVPSTMDEFAIDTLGYPSDNVYRALPDSTATSASAAVTNGCYVSFTVTPDSGYALSLTSLTFNMARGGASTPRGYDVRSSVDNYAATLGTASVTAQRPTFAGYSIDLTGASFQGLSGSTSFRIYLFAPLNVNSLDFDDVTLNGTVAASGTLEQEGFRFRNDNGTETTATWLAAQDTNVIHPKMTPVRLRVVVNATLDRGADAHQLEFRKVNDPTWLVM